MSSGRPEASTRRSNMTFRPSGPSPPPRIAARRAPRMSATSPYSGLINASSPSRNRLASVGLFPPVEIAICTAPRRTTAGAMKSHAAGVSTMFTQIRRRLAAKATCRFTSSRSVAPIMRAQPSTSSSRNAREICVMAPWPAHRRKGVVNNGLTTTTAASASRSPHTFCSATIPPPTTRQRRWARSRKIG